MVVFRGLDVPSAVAEAAPPAAAAPAGQPPPPPQVDAQAAPAHVSGAAPGKAETAPPANAPPAPPPPKPSVSTLYKGDKYRDPFLTPFAGGGGAKRTSYDPASFSIHNLELKGILKDGAEAMAIFTDTESGASFLLKGGRLLDSEDKPVPGVTGEVKAAQQSAFLTTPDKDVQTFRVGEDKEEDR